ncbi:MAG: glycosyltransferase family 2 protein [Acidobacteriota bacterium]|nr:glycosyltransferase family 2 protein [Acidobacteriota bacterium]
MPPISGVIITRNEAANIARTIRSLAPADEIVVVDSGSNDETRQIAESLGARVISHPWEGFAGQKNFAASQARHDWILSLDGDEEFNAEAQAAILKWKASEPSCHGYRFARRARYLGRWIRHSGWYPDYKVRLYHRAQGRWKGDFVHESVEVKGKVGALGGEILHFTCDSIEDHRQRIEFYTGLAADEMLKRGASPGLIRRHGAPSWAFFRSYFLRLGFLDGVPGLWIARMASLYVERKYRKWENLAKAGPDAAPCQDPRGRVRHRRDG